MAKYYIVVPHSKKDEWNDVIDFASNDSREFTVEEYRELRAPGGIYDKFDSKFNTIIDDCEEDEIFQKDIKKAIKITKEFLQEKSGNQALRKLLRCLEDADERGVSLFFVNLP